MKQLLIIPDRNHMDECLGLVHKYGLGFEYNDFFDPQILDDEDKKRELIREYMQVGVPEYTTLHGAFYDVVPFSLDEKIRQISELRIEQSIETAKEIGAKAVVFHTNYNPFLDTEMYFSMWVKTNTEYWGSVLEKHSDINIYLENMFDLCPKTLNALAENLSKYQNFGICLDYSHAFLSKTDLETWVKCLGKYVKHIHINDNDGMGDMHWAWGDGIVPHSKFYEYYKNYMDGATILIETSSMENKVRSLKKLEEDGFL